MLFSSGHFYCAVELEIEVFSIVGLQAKKKEVISIVG
jgi:hypothetical protein